MKLRNSKVEKLSRVGAARLFEVGNHVPYEDDYIRAARRVSDNPRLGLVYCNQEDINWVVVWLVPERVFHIVRHFRDRKPPISVYAGSNMRGSEIARAEIRRMIEQEKAHRQIEIDRRHASVEMGKFMRKLTHHQYDDHPALRAYVSGKKWVPVTDLERERAKSWKPSRRVMA